MHSVLKPRVMYLDCDDTLLVWTNKIPGFAAPMAAEFVKWSMEHFEIRWLTMWCPGGRMNQQGCEELSYRFGSTIHPDVFRSFCNPRRFISKKTDAIDFDEPRPWVWVEDGMLYPEKMEMYSRRADNNFYPTNVSNNVVMIQSTWRKLAKRFNLPGVPPTPFKTKMDIPITPLTVEELCNKYRRDGIQNYDDLTHAPSTGWSFN
jgi:hypothetical protein